MIRHYLLLSLKVLGRRKFYTAISIFGISFTLMVLMVATAMLDHAFGPGTPELKHDRILVLGNLLIRGPHMASNGSPGYGLLDRYARNLPGVERLSFVTGGAGSYVPVFVNGQKVEPAVMRTDADFWSIYDFEFVEGRPFTQTEFTGGRRVAVINRSTRGRLFGEQSAAGRSVDLNGESFAIIGVVEDVSMFRFGPFSDIWIPYTTDRSTAYRSQLKGDWRAIALARDDNSKVALHDEFNSRMRRAELPEGATTMVAPFETLFERVARNALFRDPTDAESQAWKLKLLLVGCAVLFALIPIVNLVNLNVSRILERSSEIGVRKAFGAPCRALVGQFVVENVILTLVGGALGLLLSTMALGAINQSGVIPYSQFALNVRVFGYALLMSLLFGLMSGIYPAWRMSRLHPVEALKGATR
jgi:putative ABC transport system permease protein